jgi:hypothetical protein
MINLHIYDIIIVKERKAKNNSLDILCPKLIKSFSRLYAGIVFDFCDWTVKRQYDSHYNASHPLLLEFFFQSVDSQSFQYVANFNPQPTIDPIPAQLNETYTLNLKPYDKSRSSRPDILSKEEFAYLMPYYPNDGVLLINIRHYNRWNILRRANEIAFRNAKGEFVVTSGLSSIAIKTFM